MGLASRGACSRTRPNVLRRSFLFRGGLRCPCDGRLAFVRAFLSLGWHDGRAKSVGRLVAFWRPLSFFFFFFNPKTLVALARGDVRSVSVDRDVRLLLRLAKCRRLPG